MALRQLLSAKGALVAGGLVTTAFLAPSVALADKEDKEKTGKRATDDRYFDPSALERGAKALRDMNNSPYAKQVAKPALQATTFHAWPVHL